VKTSLLQDHLDEITSNTRQLVQADRLAISERAVEELFTTGIEDGILPVGVIAPDFELLNANGKPIRCTDMLSFGPLVIKFFRGRWCSYCSTELEVWRDLHGRIRELGAHLVAMSPQTVRQNDFMVSQHELPFPVLSDPRCCVSEQFGLVYTVPDALRDYYLSIMNNLPFINGENSWRLPIPATYVIDRERRVLFAEAHADFRVRPEPEDALKALFDATKR